MTEYLCAKITPTSLPQILSEISRAELSVLMWVSLKYPSTARDVYFVSGMSPMLMDQEELDRMFTYPKLTGMTSWFTVTTKEQ